MFLILHEAVTLRNSALSDQIEKLQLAKSFANLFDLLIIERER
jgi:hypothetical protein